MVFDFPVNGRLTETGANSQPNFLARFERDLSKVFGGPSDFVPKGRFARAGRSILFVVLVYTGRILPARLPSCIPAGAARGPGTEGPGMVGHLGGVPFRFRGQAAQFLPGGSRPVLSVRRWGRSVTLRISPQNGPTDFWADLRLKVAT